MSTNLSKRALIHAIFCIAACLLWSSSVQAASVSGKVPKKGIVKVKGPFSKNDKVCIISSSGKRITCGKVVKTSKGTAFVKVSRKKMKQIKNGMNVSLESGGSGSKGTASNRSGGGPYTMAFGLNMQPYFVGPMSYNRVLYAEPATTPAETYFTSDDYGARGLLASGDTSNSFGMSFEYFFAPTLAAYGGLRLRYYQYDQISTDYLPSSNLDYVKNSLNATSTGFYGGTYYFLGLGGGMGLKLGGALDIDSSKVRYSAGQFYGEDDASSEEIGELYYLESSLMAISLRVDSIFTYLIAGMIGIDFGLTLFVPLSGSASQDTIRATDPNSPDEEFAKKDLIEALDHKTTFGYQIFMGASYAI